MINHDKLFELIIGNFKNINNKDDFINKIPDKQLYELPPKENNFMIKKFKKMYDNSYVFRFKTTDELYDETEILINFLKNKLTHVNIQLFVNKSKHKKNKLGEMTSILENFSKVDYYYNEMNSNKAWRNQNGLDFRLVNNFNSINLSIINSNYFFEVINKDILNSLLISAINKNLGIDFIDKVINKGANVDFKDEYEFTPIMYAVLKKNNLNIVKKLIKAGADVNAKDKDGTTPLMVAVAKNNNINIVKTLIEAGANINAKDKNGFTPLNYAKVNANDKKVIKLLNEKSNNKENKNIINTIYRGLMSNYSGKIYLISISLIIILAFLFNFNLPLKVNNFVDNTYTILAISFVFITIHYYATITYEHYTQMPIWKMLFIGLIMHLPFGGIISTIYMLRKTYIIEKQ